MFALLGLFVALGLALISPQPRAARKTVVSIQGREFLINGRPTYEGRSYDGMRIQGLLLNSRMVQGIFDDRNSETRSRWNYPDGPWDPERNTREFIDAMPLWKAKGLLAFTINPQGGSPEGYQPNAAVIVCRSRQTACCERTAWHGSNAFSIAPTTRAWSRSSGSSSGAGAVDERRAVRLACGRRRGGPARRAHMNVLVEAVTRPTTLDSADVVKPGGGAVRLIERVKERSKARSRHLAGRLLASTSLERRTRAVGCAREGGRLRAAARHGVRIRRGSRRWSTRPEAAELSGAAIVFKGRSFRIQQAAQQHARRAGAYASWGY